MTCLGGRYYSYHVRSDLWAYMEENNHLFVWHQYKFFLNIDTIEQMKYIFYLQSSKF